MLLALPHALLGWPAMAQQLLASSVSPDIVAGLAVGWYFGSVAMVALGAVVLAAASHVASQTWAYRSAWFVGLAYIVFGLGAIVLRSGRPQFLSFVALGALIVGGALQARKAAYG